MKAVVLAAGRGTRMQTPGTADLDAQQSALADRGLKILMPIHGRPFIDYVLQSLADAGVRDVAVIVTPAIAGRAHALGPARPDISVSLFTQSEPRGTADALLHIEEWAGTDQFITLNADNVYPPDVLRELVGRATPAVPGFRRDALRLPLDRIGSFALIERGADGCLTTIHEKPGPAAFEAAGPQALVSMNVWRFDRRIFDACRDVPVSSRGEKELPQAVGLAASRGVCFEVFAVAAEVLDLSSRDDVPRVASRLRP